MSLEKRYEREISQMKDRLSLKIMNMFGVILTYYLDERYGKTFFVKSKCLELYMYIDKWMTDDVFEIPNSILYGQKFEISHMPTFGVIETMRDALK